MPRPQTLWYERDSVKELNMGIEGALLFTTYVAVNMPIAHYEPRLEQTVYHFLFKEFLSSIATLTTAPDK